MPSLAIHDRTPGGRMIDTVVLDGLPERITVRELIRTRVRDEVARHNLRPSVTFRGLVAPDDAEQLLEGYRLRTARTIDWERQADAAVDAFGRNGFFVLINGRQALSLDDEVTVGETADVAFVKLVQLVGG